MGQTSRQVRHYYVTNKFGIADGFTADKHLDETGDLGEMKAFINDSKNHLYFEYRGHGGVTRTDLIPLKSIEYLNISKKEDLRIRLKGQKITLTLPSTIRNTVLTFKLKVTGLRSLSDTDAQYAIFSLNLYTGVTYTESNLFKEIAVGLAKGVERSLFNSVDVFLTKDGGRGTKVLVPVKASTKIASLTDTYENIVLKEAKPLGWSEYTGYNRINFSLDVATNNEVDNIVTVADAGLDYTKPENYVGNGIKVKDDEYFYLKGRGNVYGLKQDYVSPSLGVADITKEYDVLDIHYSFTDDGESSYKSEKDITIAGKKAELDLIVAKLKGARETSYVAPTAPKKGATLEEC